MLTTSKQIQTTSKSIFTRKLRFYSACVGIFHWFLHLFLWRQPVIRPPKKILLGNLGSLGDLVLSTGVIERIKSAFPDCQIGVAVSKESQKVFETAPPVDWIHVLRAPLVKPGQTTWQKIVDFLRFSWIDQPRFASEIASVGYDSAIELRPFFPNLTPLFWKAKIPIRIGFAAGMNGRLLNVPVDWKGDRYLPHCYSSLLAQIGIEQKGPQTLMPRMILKNPPPLLTQKPYLLFHLSSFKPEKELPIEFWRALYLKCKEWGWTIYFTGKGEREFRIIEEVTKDPKENLCDRLSWKQLVQHVKECSGLISIDSVPIHLAASFGTPTLALFWRTHLPLLWKPDVSTTIALGIEKPLNIEDALQVIEGWR